jgi:hypothetical protein
MPKSCFVIGPIGEPGTAIRSHADDFIQYIVNPTVNDLGFTAARADKMPDPGRITTQIIEQLKDADLVIADLVIADLVIADLTDGNPNVYYELSLRHGVGKPVIHMALDGTRIPFDVFDSRTIMFTLECRRAETAREELTKQITRVQEDNYRASNPIIEAIGIIELRGSQRTNDQQMAELMLKVEHLSANVAVLQSQLTTNSSAFLQAGARVGGSNLYANSTILRNNTILDSGHSGLGGRISNADLGLPPEEITRKSGG